MRDELSVVGEIVFDPEMVRTALNGMCRVSNLSNFANDIVLSYYPFLLSNRTNFSIFDLQTHIIPWS